METRHVDRALIGAFTAVVLSFVAESYGGQVGVDSTPEGCAFWFTLPVSVAPRDLPGPTACACSRRRAIGVAALAGFREVAGPYGRDLTPEIVRLSPQREVFFQRVGAKGMRPAPSPRHETCERFRMRPRMRRADFQEGDHR